MDGRQIAHYLRGSTCYIGSYSRDNLPAINKLPAAFIANTDEAHDPGTHWIAIFIDEELRGVYFDSFGLPPLFSDFIRYLDYNCQSWIYNNLTLQNVNSSTCGLYCILFVKFVCRQIALSDFFKLYSSNTLVNDELIKNYV